MRKVAWLAVLCAVLGAVSAVAQTATPAPTLRTWTTVDGRSFQAALVSLQGTQITLRTPAGQLSTLPLLRLSLADQTFIRGQQPGAKPVRIPAEKRPWPAVVQVDNRALEVTLVSETPAAQKFVYHSKTFEFTAEDKIAGSVMKEIARTFEATYSLVQALPWGIDPQPPADLGYYQAKFFLNRSSYLASGAPPNSGGVYFSKDRIFRVPFESLGLVQRGKTWFKDDRYRSDVVVHEITHQMMHDFLPFLPMWVAEGTAEYTAMLPFSAGRFVAGSHERGIKEYLKSATEAGLRLGSVGSFHEHLLMTGAEWQAKARSGGTEQRGLYFTSALLVYYFSHLDGDGKGLKFLRYFDKMAEARDAWAAFFKDPRVKLQSDGTFQYPSDLPLPSQKMRDDYGLEHVSILLDGRDGPKLQKEVLEGFKKIGIR